MSLAASAIAILVLHQPLSAQHVQRSGTIEDEDVESPLSDESRQYSRLLELGNEVVRLTKARDWNSVVRQHFAPELRKQISPDQYGRLVAQIESFGGPLQGFKPQQWWFEFGEHEGKPLVVLKKIVHHERFSYYYAFFVYADRLDQLVGFRYVPRGPAARPASKKEQAPEPKEVKPPEPKPGDLLPHLEAEIRSRRAAGRSVWGSYNHVLAAALEKDRARLGPNFQSQVMRFVGADVEAAYWIACFLGTYPELEGEKRRFELAVLVYTQGIAVCEAEARPCGDIVSLKICAAIAAQRVGLTALAAIYKYHVRTRYKEDRFVGTTPALDEADRKVYESIPEFETIMRRGANRSSRPASKKEEPL